VNAQGRHVIKGLFQVNQVGTPDRIDSRRREIELKVDFLLLNE
jgi:hypothetical protein